MNILIIGFGSIGKRHYRNLLKLGYINLSIYDPDDSAFVGFTKISRIKSFTRKTIKDFHVAFICSPNNQHVRNALICAEAGCHLFIEKPVSHSLTNLDKLRDLCIQKKLITLVGCNMRFHPCLKKIKDYLEKDVLGKVFSIQLEFGHYLPYWRSSQDYTKNYAAKKLTGGGIILDDIHEFDLLFWLNNFENFKEAKFIFDKVSDLKIETEDICLAIFKFKNKVFGLVSCDYLQQSYSRSCKVIGERANLVWDFSKNSIIMSSKSLNETVFKITKFDVNQMYFDELKYFFNCIDKNEKTFNDISRATNLLKDILFLKKK